MATIYFFDDFYFSKTENDIINNSQVLNQALYGAISEGDDDAVENTLQLIAEINSGQAWLVNEEGLMINSYPKLESLDSAIRFLNSGAIFEGNVISQRVETQHFERPMLLIGMPVRQMEDVAAGLLVFTSVEGVNSTIRQVIMFMLYSSLLAIILGLILAYGWSKTMASPLKHMSEVAKELGEGDYGRQVDFADHNPSKEMSNLRDSFNTLSVNLEDSISELTRERNKLKYILTGMEEGVLAVDSQDEVIVANQAFNKIFKLKEDPVNKDFQEVSFSNRIKNSIESSLQNEEAIREEFTIEYDNENSKQERRIILKCNPVFIHDEVWAVVALFQDISERWRFEKLQQDFVANVSHELKAPLSSIRGSAEILLDGIVKDTEKEDEYLEMILNESERLTELVDEILALAEYQDFDLYQDQETIRAGALLKEAAGTFQKSGPLAGRIEVIDNAKGVEVSVNKDSIKQVLFNFLDNAHKFSPEDSQVFLSVEAGDEGVIFKVKDQGLGIPPEEQENIWERFYKIDKARTPGSPGSGLGLAICKEIITSHGGKVFVNSEYGAGSTFGFILPEAD
ncbi:MAG: ATP-binding protein [Bacillota bacterium]